MNVRWFGILQHAYTHKRDPIYLPNKQSNSFTLEIEDVNVKDYEY